MIVVQSFWCVLPKSPQKGIWTQPLRKQKMLWLLFRMSTRKMVSKKKVSYCLGLLTSTTNKSTKTILVKRKSLQIPPNFQKQKNCYATLLNCLRRLFISIICRSFTLKWRTQETKPRRFGWWWLNYGSPVFQKTLYESLEDLKDTWRGQELAHLFAQLGRTYSCKHKPAAYSQAIPIDRAIKLCPHSMALFWKAKTLFSPRIWESFSLLRKGIQTTRTLYRSERVSIEKFDSVIN